MIKAEELLIHIYIVENWKELKGLVTVDGKDFYWNDQVFGKNPNYSNVLTDNLLPLERGTSSHIVIDNLNVMNLKGKFIRQWQQ